MADLQEPAGKDEVTAKPAEAAAIDDFGALRYFDVFLESTTTHGTWPVGLSV